MLSPRPCATTVLYYRLNVRPAALRWKLPSGADEAPLTRAACAALIRQVAEASADDHGAEPVLARLACPRGPMQPPEPHVLQLTALLQRWYELSDGCTVVSTHPPRLSGAVPQHLRASWSRVPRLVELGLL